ncbi:MAG TPA: hypothetical protein VKF83_06510 [Stellaceae bacterium]|nr:hypothetical protein [Stellaceae bacterium]
MTGSLAGLAISLQLCCCWRNNRPTRFWLTWNLLPAHRLGIRRREGLCRADRDRVLANIEMEKPRICRPGVEIFVGVETSDFERRLR